MFRRRALAGDVQRLGPGRCQLRARPRQVQFADVAFVVAALDQRQRPFAQGHGTAVEFLPRIQLPHQEIRLRDVGLHGQQHRAQQCLALPGPGRRRIDAGRDPAEQVHLVGHAGLGTPQRGRGRIRLGGQSLRDRRRPLPRGAGARVHARVQVGPRLAQPRPGLCQPCHRCLEILVRVRRARLQLIQHRIAEYRPPVSTVGILGRPGGLPVASGRFLERHRHVGPERIIDGRHRAARQHEQGHRCRSPQIFLHGILFHFSGSAWCAATMGASCWAAECSLRAPLASRSST